MKLSPDSLNQYNEDQIKEIGLKIIHVIKTSEIEYDTKALKELIDNINNELYPLSRTFLNFSAQLFGQPFLTLP